MEPNPELFSARDRELLEASRFDPTLKPIFNPLSALLIWDDEMPLGVSSDGHDTLTALWLARAHMYYGYELPSRLLNADYIRSVWNRAIESRLQWAGFQRLSLSDEDKQYYLAELQRDRPEGI